MLLRCDLPLLSVVQDDILNISCLYDLRKWFDLNLFLFFRINGLSIDNNHMYQRIINNNSLVDRNSSIEMRNNNKIFTYNHIESMWLVIPPIPKNILSIIAVDKCHPIDFPIVPFTDIHVEVIINKYAWTMPLV